MEEFVDIKNFEWRYQVSDLGRIKSLPKKWSWGHNWKILKYWKDGDWYLFVILYKNWKARKYAIHRLVWQAFLWLDISNSKILVCHKNDIPWDNRKDNLFLGTYKDNNRDCVSKGRGVDNKGEKNWMSKLTENKVRKIKLLLKNWNKWKDIAKKIGISEQVTSHIKLWKIWTHIKLL